MGISGCGNEVFYVSQSQWLIQPYHIDIHMELGKGFIIEQITF